MNWKSRILLALIIFALVFPTTSSGLPVSQASAQKAEIAAEVPAEIREALGLISADSLRGHLSFIASDLLEGRSTPSPGLDIAAEYIAAQFRRAGLEPVGDDGYFQTANWQTIERNLNGFTLTLQHEKQTVAVAASQVSLAIDTPLDLVRASVVKVDYQDRASIDALTEEQVAGKVVFTEIAAFRGEERVRRSEMFRMQNGFLARLRTLKAALVLSIDRQNATGNGAGTSRLIDPENRPVVNSLSSVPMITLHDAKAIALHDALTAGATKAAVSLHLAAPYEKPVKLRNVVGILRGADATLKDSYILVTAHYDHIGKQEGLPGDQVYNGANDDGSGTVSVIELAAALATLKQRPKRTLVFMTVFGEEKGLLGSRYYGRHPIFPIEKTVANLNLEQVGRTDSTEGPQLANASITGFDYSDVGMILQRAGALTGVTVYKHERNSDAYFGRSDNQALADQGVPAHTLCTAFNYPDYHGVGDHWDKIDYANMAKINRTVALAIWMMAESDREPQWNATNPKAERYFKAWKTRRGM